MRNKDRSAAANGAHAYTLIEMLAVLAVATVLLAGIGTIFSDTWSVSHRLLRRAGENQLLGLLLRQWQRDVGRTHPGDWLVVKDTFKAGGLAVYRDDTGLVFDDGVKKKTLHIPATMRVSFAVEKKEGLADCAILTVTSRMRYFRAVHTNNVRIISCGTR